MIETTPTSDPRADIIALTTRYARAIDDSDFSSLDHVFTPDADVDYSATGGIHGRYDEVRPWLKGVLAEYKMLRHTVSGHDIAVDKRVARSRCYVRALHGREVDGTLRFFELGGRYHDKCVLTASGWRIAERRLERIWVTRVNAADA